jgi:hypothetical protein
MARGSTGRVLNVRADTLDFRDKMFVPTLVEVPSGIDLDTYLGRKVPILDQGTEGACTGFGLATVVNYLLRVRKHIPERVCVSPRLLYEMAKRYDEWPGEGYEGSSARGAMKGWHKHGICEEQCWPYADGDRDEKLYGRRWTDALRRPLGAYYRVNHRDLIAMHCAIAEVGILYATASVHTGWNRVKQDGIIRQSPDLIGGHAFAIVAYDERGFWLQNSWGTAWGREGLGHLSYDDWLANGTDMWVARLGAPVVLHSGTATAIGIASAARGSRSYVFCDLRPHIISTGNDGLLRTDGTYGTSEEDVTAIFEKDIPAITKGWGQRRLVLYVHGGLVPEDSVTQRLADYRAVLLAAQVYPLAFVWHSDYWSTLLDILQDALGHRRPEGILDASKDFMLDRLDDALEPLARALSGKAEWDEMKENALAATTAPDGGARIAARHLAALIQSDPSIELHVVAHSAGAIFLGPLLRLLTDGNGDGLGLKIATCTLWAPACTLELFKEYYLPVLTATRSPVKRFTLFTLTDDAEREDNCANIYHKSLLYLVSNAFEAKPRIPNIPGLPDFRPGVPLLGLARSINADKRVKALLNGPSREWVLAPNDAASGNAGASRARHHGDFDDDATTLKATLARIVGSAAAPKEVTIHRSASWQRARRGQLVAAAAKS